MTNPFTQPLDTYSLSFLLARYNEIAAEHSLSGRSAFRNKASAVKAVASLLAQVESMTEESPGLTRLRASPQAEGVRGTILADQLRASLEAADAHMATEPVPPVADTPPVAKRSRTTISGSETITVLSPTNPKRAGSAAHANFAAYRDGMTVDQYGAAIRSFVKAKGNVRWDVAHGFIRLD